MICSGVGGKSSKEGGRELGLDTMAPAHAAKRCGGADGMGSMGGVLGRSGSSPSPFSGGEKGEEEGERGVSPIQRVQIDELSRGRPRTKSLNGPGAQAHKKIALHAR